MNAALVSVSSTSAVAPASHGKLEGQEIVGEEERGCEPTEAMVEFDLATRDHLPMMFGIALRKTGNVQEAEDLLQDTLERAWGKLHLYQPGTNIRAWLLTIMAHLAIGGYRRKEREPDIVSLDMDDSTRMPAAWQDSNRLAGAQDLESYVLDRLEIQAIIAAVDALPIEFSLAVRLADVEDRPVRDIADIMGIPLGTVGSRIYRGRRLIRSGLRDQTQGPCNHV